MQRRKFLELTGSLGLTLGLAPFAMASDEPIVLTVKDITVGTTKQYTDADLMALPQISFQTTTIWTEGAKTFSGPSLYSVLKDAGIAPQNMQLYAVNDYNAQFPVESLHDMAPIIANRIDGKPFPLRRKGPLWIIYPFDPNPVFKSEEIFALCVWQLNKITVGNL